LDRKIITAGICGWRSTTEGAATSNTSGTNGVAGFENIITISGDIQSRRAEE
jgi:hypothetical protein